MNARAMYVTENQDRNGVRVRVHRWRDGTTSVDASCSCLGSPGRVHSNAQCPMLTRSRED